MRFFFKMLKQLNEKDHGFFFNVMIYVITLSILLNIAPIAFWGINRITSSITKNSLITELVVVISLIISIVLSIFIIKKLSLFLKTKAIELRVKYFVILLAAYASLTLIKYI